MSTYMYKGEPMNDPGVVDFGGHDISGVGDGTVTGAIKDVDERTNKLMPVRLSKRVSHTVKASNTYELVTSITIPANCFYVFSAHAEWSYSKGLGVFISSSNTNYAASANWSETTANENNHGKSANAIGETYDGSQTFYIWAKWAGTTTNPLTVSGFYIHKA